jgi:hypothetical protein
MELEDSLLCSQEPVIIPYPEPVHIAPFFFSNGARGSVVR